MVEADGRDLRAVLKQMGTTYPRVINLSKSVRNKVNDQIREAAFLAIPDYDPGTTVIEAWSSYKTPLNQKGILSLRFEDYFFPEMAAHGVSGVSSVTINMHTGYTYRFYELFHRGSNYQAVINAIIQEQIVARQIPMLKPFEGVRPNEQFYLTRDSLVIYYQPYDYTPGAFGVLEFTIPYQQITAIFDPRGPVGILTTMS